MEIDHSVVYCDVLWFVAQLHPSTTRPIVRLPCLSLSVSLGFGFKIQKSKRNTIAIINRKNTVVNKTFWVFAISLIIIFYCYWHIKIWVDAKYLLLLLETQSHVSGVKTVEWATPMGFPRMRLHKPQSTDVSLYTRQSKKNRIIPRRQNARHMIVIGKDVLKPATIESLYKKNKKLFSNSVVNICG